MWNLITTHQITGTWASVTGTQGKHLSGVTEHFRLLSGHQEVAQTLTSSFLCHIWECIFIFQWSTKNVPSLKENCLQLSLEEAGTVCSLVLCWNEAIYEPFEVCSRNHHFIPITLERLLCFQSPLQGQKNQADNWATPSYLTSASSLDCLQLISKGKQHLDYPGGIAGRTDGCLWEARSQSDEFVGASTSLGMTSSTFLGDTIFGV